MYKVLLPIIFISFCNFSFAQRDLEKAIKLGETYPENDVYIAKNIVDFHLEYNRPDKTVIAIQKEQTDLIGLNSDIYDVFYKDYNQISSYIEYARFNSETDRNCRIYNSDYSSNEIFHDDIKLKIIEVYFKHRGDYRSFITKKRFLDLKYIEPIYLANFRPTEEKEVHLSIENDLEFEILEFNFENFDIKKEYSFDEKSQLHKYDYKISNPPHVNNKDDIRGPSYYLPHIIIVPKSYNSKKYNQKYFSDVSDLYKWYYGLVKSVNDDKNQLSKFINTLVDDNDTDLEKIKKIYYWVQQNIRYIAFEDGIAGFKPDAAHEVLNKTYGDCKGIANLTKNLLQIAGFDARLAWIGTNSRAYDYSIPSLIVDNHMICALFFNDSIYYLDGTERFMPFGHNAERIQNKSVLIENGEDFLIKKVPVQKYTDNIIQRNTEVEITDNSMRGKSLMTYTGESKSRIKSYLNRIANDKKTKALKNFYESEDMEIKDITYANIENIDSLFSINFDFTNDNAIMSFDDEIYITFENYFDFYHTEIDSTLLFDYDINYKREIKSKTTFQIPKDYNVTFLPQDISIKNNDFIIEVNFQKMNDQIIYNKNIKILNGLIHHENIKGWNSAHEKLIEMYKSNIILKKA